MLTHHRKPVCLSLVALDLPVWSVVETAATVYEKTPNQFHVLLTEPTVQGDRVFSHPFTQPSQEEDASPQPHSARLLWLEISPYRVIMTMQGNGILSYSRGQDY